MTVNGAATQTSLSEQVAEEIRALLARRRISGRELARRLGVSHSWMNFRLTGAQPIDLNDLQRIADVLGVNVIDLLPRSQEGRTVVVSGTPGGRTTFAKPTTAKRPQLDGRPPNLSRGASTHRTFRLAAARPQQSANR